MYPGYLEGRVQETRFAGVIGESRKQDEEFPARVYRQSIILKLLCQYKYCAIPRFSSFPLVFLPSYGEDGRTRFSR